MSNIELFKSEDQALTSLRVLCEDEFNSLKENGRVLVEFQRHHSLIEYVIINFNNLCELFYGKANILNQTQTGLFNYPFDNFYLEANSVILNFLASSRTFLDHMETHIKKKFTDKSPQYQNFRSSTVNEFDSNFSYRLMGKLRNFVTHCGMPPLSYDLIKKFNHEASSIKIELKVYFMKKELLEEYAGWGSIVKEDLQKQDDLIPAIYLFHEYMLSLIKVHVNYTKNFLLPDVVNAKENILCAINEKEGFASNVYHYGEISSSENKEDGVNIKISTIPASLLNKVYHFEGLVKLVDRDNCIPFQLGELQFQNLGL